MFPGAGFVKMYYFAIDLESKMPYPLAPPQGREKEQLANSNWQLARPNPKTIHHKGHEETRRKNVPTARQIQANRRNPRQSGMAWDAPLASARQSGMTRGGGRGRIAVIADIARDRERQNLTAD